MSPISNLDARRKGDQVRPLGELETAVMDRLWSMSGPATVRDVLHGLDREPPPAYTTVMTVLDNLHRKGLLRRQRQGRAYAYQPVNSREEYGAGLMAEVLDTSTDRTATLLSFVAKIDPTELARLRQRLAEEDGTA